MAEVPSYCLDSNVYIDRLDDKADAPIAEIRAIIEAVERGDASLLVPVLAYTEVVEAQRPGDPTDKFRGFLRRSNVVSIDITLTVADKAQSIRSACWKMRPKRKLATVDAVFVAAAILFRADVLCTRDAQLLGLDGLAAVDGLKITEPKPLD